MRRNLLFTTGLVALSLSTYPILAQEAQPPRAGAESQAPAAARSPEATGSAQQGDTDQLRPAARPKAGEPAQAAQSRGADEGDRPSGGNRRPQGQEATPKASSAGQTGEKASGETTTKGTAERPKPANNAQQGEGETRTQRQAEPNATNKGEAADETNRNAPKGAKGQAEQPARAERTPSGNRNEQADDNRDQKGTAASPRNDANGQGGTQVRRAGGERGGVQVRGRLKIDEARASSVRDTFTRHRDAEIHDRSIRFAVGVAIPAAIDLAVVPDEIISEYPEFRGYDYVTEEDEVAIIDPRSREIVEVIGSNGDRAARGEGSGDRPRREVRFSSDQNAIIRRSVSVGSYGGERPALLVPGSVDLKPLPPGLADQLHADTELGYFVDREDRIVVADPQTREVLDIVE